MLIVVPRPGGLAATAAGKIIDLDHPNTIQTGKSASHTAASSPSSGSLPIRFMGEPDSAMAALSFFLWAGARRRHRGRIRDHRGLHGLRDPLGRRRRPRRGDSSGPGAGP